MREYIVKLFAPCLNELLLLHSIDFSSKLHMLEADEKPWKGSLLMDFLKARGSIDGLPFSKQSLWKI